MTVLFLLIHCLHGDFWKLQESQLISFLKDHVFVIVLFFEIKVKWAALINDPLNMLAVNLIDVWQHLFKNSICVPGFTNVLTLKVLDDHANIKAVVDGTCHRQVDSLLQDSCLLCVIISWEFNLRKIDPS